MQTTQIQSFTDPGITYEITDDGQGHITCTCPDFVNRRAALGTTCKHIRAHLEKTYSIPDLQTRDGKPFVLNQKGKLVSWAQWYHLTHRAQPAARGQAPAPAAKPAPVVITAAPINTDAIALVDMLGTLHKLGGTLDKKTDGAITACIDKLTAGKTQTFSIPIDMLGVTITFRKAGRGWGTPEITKNA